MLVVGWWSGWQVINTGDDTVGGVAVVVLSTQGGWDGEATQGRT